ncbi:MAG: hypothetical protein RJA36_1613 [Pseudomonadota bacterium]|jgi:hypothetical protein
MRSIEWSFYAPDTGLLSPAKSLLPEGVDPIGFAPAGHLPIEGRLDHLSCRVDVAAVRPQDQAETWRPPVVDYVPPAPPDDELQTWAWDREARRWISSPTRAALQLLQTRELAAAIAEQEAAQARPTREVLMALAAGKPAPTAALQKLAAIEQAVAPLRQQIQAAVADVRTPAADAAPGQLDG